jgi:branched-chain amino acid transport system ATP-binding protein
MTDSASLELAGVSASYGNENVVIDTSLKVRPGEICAVLGANGAGKTSLLRLIMGLMPRVSGSVKGPDGVQLAQQRTHAVARLGVGYVPEGRGILFSLSVRENLLLGTTPLGRKMSRSEEQDRLERELDRFPALRDRLDHRAGVLSGGQQQMLAIGRALIAHPKVLLLDEPSLGLAPLIRIEIAQILSRLKGDSGLAILLVEQDVTLVERCADYAYVMRRGRLTERLTHAELGDRERLRSLYLFGEARESLRHA